MNDPCERCQGGHDTWSCTVPLVTVFANECVERRVAIHQLGIDPGVRAARAMVVGEAAGRAGQRVLPLFPYPPNSAGGRLSKLYGRGHGAYLRTFARRNLLELGPEHGEWDKDKARRGAERILREIRASEPTVDMIYLLGRRVWEAFGVPPDASVFDRYSEECSDGIWLWVPPAHRRRYVLLPHPSGRNLELNDAAVRHRVTEALQEAIVL